MEKSNFRPIPKLPMATTLNLETTKNIQENIARNLAGEQNLLLELVKKVLKQILKRDATDDDFTKVVLAKHSSSQYPYDIIDGNYGFAFDSVIYGNIKSVSQHNLIESTDRYSFSIGYIFVPNANYSHNE